MDPYQDFLRKLFRLAGQIWFERVQAELWEFAEPFYAWLYNLFEHPYEGWDKSLDAFLAEQAAAGRVLSPESRQAVIDHIEAHLASLRGRSHRSRPLTVEIPTHANAAAEHDKYDESVFRMYGEPPEVSKDQIESWKKYEYYLRNPSRMDADLQTARKIALGTSAAAVGGALGLTAGGATAAYLVATGATVVDTSAASTAIGLTVAVNSGYAIGIPFGEDVAQIGSIGASYILPIAGVLNAPSGVRNFRGEPVSIPEGHVMSPRDPAMSASPVVERGPFTTAQREAMLRGGSGGTRLSPHHRHQIPATHGGVIDELPGPGHPAGNVHTAGSPSRHPSPSVFNSLEGGNASRNSEIRAHWQAKAQRMIEVEPGVWIDPGL